MAVKNVDMCSNECTMLGSCNWDGWKAGTRKSEFKEARISKVQAFGVPCQVRQSDEVRERLF